RHDGQEQAHGRTNPFAAIDADATARLLDEAIDLAEAETGSLADRLSREKGLEDAFASGRRHTNAGVADRQFDMFARHRLLLGPIFCLSKIRAVGGYRNPPALRHRIACIDYEVEHRHLELIAVGKDSRKPRDHVESKSNAAAKRPANHCVDPLHG